MKYEIDIEEVKSCSDCPIIWVDSKGVIRCSLTNKQISAIRIHKDCPLKKVEE